MFHVWLEHKIFTLTSLSEYDYPNNIPIIMLGEMNNWKPNYTTKYLPDIKLLFLRVGAETRINVGVRREIMPNINFLLRSCLLKVSIQKYFAEIIAKLTKSCFWL